MTRRTVVRRPVKVQVSVRRTVRVRTTVTSRVRRIR